MISTNADGTSLLLLVDITLSAILYSAFSALVAQFDEPPRRGHCEILKKLQFF